MRQVRRLCCSLRRIFILRRTYFGWKSLCTGAVSHLNAFTWLALGTLTDISDAADCWELQSAWRS